MALVPIPPSAPGLNSKRIFSGDRPITCQICADSIDAYGTNNGALYADPGTIPAIAGLGASFNSPASGSATWDLLVSGGRYLLGWASPGDTIGARVDVTAGGTYLFASATSGVTNIAGIKPAGLPGSSVTATVAYSVHACAKKIGGWRHMLQDMRYGSLSYINFPRSIPGQTIHDAIIPGGLIDQAIADNADVLHVALGINDFVINNSSSAVVFADWVTAVTRILASGRVFIYSVPSPLWGLDANGVVYAGAAYLYNSTQEANRADFIRQVMEYAATLKNPLLYIEDTDRLMTDTTSTQGRAKNGSTVDSIHYQGGGAQFRAMSTSEIWEEFAPLTQVIQNRCASTSYNASTQPGGNLLPSGQGTFTGSGGTAGAGVTGVIPAGLTIARSVGSALTAASNTVGAVDGGSNQLELRLSGSAAVTEVMRILFGSSSIANFSVGDNVIMEFEVEIVGDGIYGMDFQYFLTGITTPSVVQAFQWQTVVDGIRVSRFKITSLPFVWQAGITGTSAQFHIQTLVGSYSIVRLRGGNFKKVLS